MQHPDTDTVAIGRFDGLHLGHMALASHLGPRGMLVVIDTLSGDLTPASFLSRFTRIPFCRLEFSAIRHLTPEEFIGFLREIFPHLGRIVVGEDFRFGCGRSGDTTMLRELFAGKVEIVPELTLDGEPIRSSRIRHHISLGNIARANALLGREYRVFARAVSVRAFSVGPFLLPPAWKYPIRISGPGTFEEDCRVVDEHLIEAPATIDLRIDAEYEITFRDYTA